VRLHRPSQARRGNGASVQGAALGGKGASGHAAALHFGGRRKAPTALWCSVSWPAAELASFAALTALRQRRRVRRTKRAARAAMSPVLLGASEARRVLPERAFADTLVGVATDTAIGAVRRIWRRLAQPIQPEFAPRITTCYWPRTRPVFAASLVAVRMRTAIGQRGGRCPVGAISGAASSAGLRSARAARFVRLTRRRCPNAANAVSAVSSAARPRAEQRSGVGAQRRPLQHEPTAGAARRAAPRQRSMSPTVGAAHRAAPHPLESGRAETTAIPRAQTTSCERYVWLAACVSSSQMEPLR
jgi:hypothetical protein